MARRLGCVWRNRDGASALEFALIAPALCALLIAILETSLVFLAQQGIETAADDAARLLMTGQAQASYKGSQTQTPAQQFHDAACVGLPAFLSCSRLYVDVSTATSFSGASTSAPTFTYDAQGNVSNSFSYAPGTQNAIVVLRLMYLWPTSTGPLNFNLANQPASNRLLVATSVLKTETY